MPNVYYNPEKFDLEIVACLDEPDLSYEYDTFLVFRHMPTGRLFYAQDSGCSCPTPFEEFHFKGPDDTDMAEIKAGSDGFELELTQWAKSAHIKSDELDAVLVKVKGMLK